jgi:hypothetical protein
VVVAWPTAALEGIDTPPGHARAQVLDPTPTGKEYQNHVAVGLKSQAELQKPANHSKHMANLARQRAAE